MEIAFLAVGLVALLVGLVCNIIVLIDAFKASVGEGFMCLCIPCYILFYMFSKFEHPQKPLIIAGSLGGSLVGNILIRLATPGQPHSYGSGY